MSFSFTDDTDDTDDNDDNDDTYDVGGDWKELFDSMSLAELHAADFAFIADNCSATVASVAAAVADTVRRERYAGRSYYVPTAGVCLRISLSRGKWPCGGSTYHPHVIISKLTPKERGGGGGAVVAAMRAAKVFRLCLTVQCDVQAPLPKRLRTVYGSSVFCSCEPYSVETVRPTETVQPVQPVH